MPAFFDGAVLSAISLFVALVIGFYAEAHPDWRIFVNEAFAVTISVVLTTTMIVGCVTAVVACAENGLALLPWMALFVAIQAVAVALYRTLRRFMRPRDLPAAAT